MTDREKLEEIKNDYGRSTGYSEHEFASDMWWLLCKIESAWAETAALKEALVVAEEALQHIKDDIEENDCKSCLAANPRVSGLADHYSDVAWRAMARIREGTK